MIRLFLIEGIWIACMSNRIISNILATLMIDKYDVIDLIVCGIDYVQHA